MDDLQNQFKEQINEYLHEIQDRIVELFKDSIQEAVYDISDTQMTWWERTEDFKNSVSIQYDSEGALVVYVDTDKLDYYSYINFQKTDIEVSDSLPMWLEDGHNSDKPNQYGMYANYNGRNYLELAYEKINSEFPDLQVQILKDEEI
jgi:hypothetical protein